MNRIGLGNALRQHPRDKYFVSVKFGALPSREALYGVDMNPFNVRAHLTYSLRRLGLDYVDLYEPARMDDVYPVEEVIEAINELVKEGLVRHVGMTECTAEELRRGNKVCPIKYFEKEYSLLSRKMEEEDLPTCRELGIPVVAYGLLGHGLLTDGFATGERTPHVLPFLFRPEDMEYNRAIVQQLKEHRKGFRQYLQTDGAIEGLGDGGIAIPSGVAGDDDVGMEMLLMAQLAGLLPSC